MPVGLALIQPTRTGKEKSIMDATVAVRNYLVDNERHNYETQRLSASEHGIKIGAMFLKADQAEHSVVSMYRPKTKKGDPHIWVSKFSRYASPDDILAISAHGGKLYVINLTKVDIKYVLDQKQSGALWKFLEQISSEATAVAHELLQHLRIISKFCLISGSRAIEKCLEPVTE